MDGMSRGYSWIKSRVDGSKIFQCITYYLMSKILFISYMSCESKNY